MKNKREKIFLISTISLAILFVLIMRFLVKNKIYMKHKKDMIYMYTEKGDVYTLGNKNLGSNIIGTAYSDGLKKHIIIDSVFDAYLVDEEGEKNKFASNINSSDKIVCLGDIIYYIDSKGNLYEKTKESKNSTKIDSDVIILKALDDKKIIYYNKELDLYIKNLNKESIKIASKVEDYKFNKDNKKVVYVSNKSIYLYDIEKDLKNKVFKGENYVVCHGFAWDGGLVYEVYDSQDSYFKCSIYYKGLNKKEAIKLDSKVDLAKITPNGQGIFYTIENEGTYYRSLNKEKSFKIYDKAIGIYNVSNDRVYGIEDVNDKKNLKEIDNKGNKKTLIENIDLKFVQMYKDSIAYLTNNNTLYIDKVKIAENIKNFYIKGKDIVYLTKNNKMFILKDGKHAKELISNISKYKIICISNKFKYDNTLSINDIKGSWIQKDNKHFMIKFHDNTEEQIGLYLKHNYQITSKDNKYNSMTIKLEGAYTQKIKFIDDNNIEILGEIYNKIGDNVFENFRNVLDSTKKAADAYLKGNTVLLQTYYDKNNKEYFIYLKRGDKPSYVMVDEKGELFNHDSFYTLEKSEPIKM